jgi:hypothetical protein
MLQSGSKRKKKEKRERENVEIAYFVFFPFLSTWICPITKYSDPDEQQK